MKENVFFQGAEPGAPRTEQEIKLLLMYLLSCSDIPLSLEDAGNILLEQSLVNYFEFASCWNELEYDKMFIKDETDACTLSDKAKKIIEGLGDKLSLSVREKVDEAVKVAAKRKKSATENKVEITKSENGYYVECTIPGVGESTMMSIKLSVATLEQAKKVQNNFLDNTSLIYTVAVALLSGDTKMLRLLL